MDKKYIEENEIEIKYLRDQLSAEELEEFEVYLMENPKVLNRLELDEVIQSNISAIAKRVTRQKRPNFGIRILISYLPVAITFSLVGAFVATNLHSFYSERVTSDIFYIAESRGGATQDINWSQFAFPKSQFGYWSTKNFFLIDDSGTRELVNLIEIYRIDSLGTRKELIETIKSKRKNPLMPVMLVLKVKEYVPGNYLVQVQPESKSASASSTESSKFYFKTKIADE